MDHSADKPASAEQKTRTVSGGTRPEGRANAHDGAASGAGASGKAVAVSARGAGRGVGSGQRLGHYDWIKKR